MKLSYELLTQTLPTAQLYSGSNTYSLNHESAQKIIALHERSYTFSIDTRTIKSSEIFVALLGEQTDGHLYISQAIEKGAPLIILQKNHAIINQIVAEHPEILCIGVDDTYDALITLAAHVRAQFHKPIIGITGSMGKTTTKEMVGAILKAASIDALISQGNQNTLVGIALNLLRLESHHMMGVFEVGINAIGEMQEIVALLKPTMAAITAIGHAHGHGLGTRESIAREKRVLFSLLGSDGVGIVHGDCPFIGTSSYAHPIIRFGCKMRNQVHARLIKQVNNSIEFVLRAYDREAKIVLPTTNDALVHNALCATAIAYALGISFDAIVEGIQSFKPVQGRFFSCALSHDRGVVIDDAYNANPESMKAALLAFHHMRHHGTKIAVLGDMLELGEQEIYWHRLIGRFLRKTTSINRVIFVGKHAIHMAKTAPLSIKISCVNNWQEAHAQLSSLLQHDSLVLIKGSGGMNLRNITKALMQDIII